MRQTLKTKVVLVTALALLFLPIKKDITPYGVVGLGAYYMIYDYEGALDDVNNEFNFGCHLGFGVEFPINRNSMLNIDYRYRFLNPDENEMSTENAGPFNCRDLCRTFSSKR